MLDERSVTWKVLYPPQPQDSILAIGLDAGALTGLARSWNRIDCVCSQEIAHLSNNLSTQLSGNIQLLPSFGHIQKKYDYVVLGSWPHSYTLNLNHITSFLTDHAFLFCLGYAGCPVRTKDLKRAGLSIIEHYAAIPYRQPKVFFPLGSRRVRAQGLKFHVPGRNRSRWILDIAKSLSNLGCKSHLARQALIIASAGTVPSEKETLIRWLTRKIGYPVEHLVLYTGSQSPHRKITALAISTLDKKDIVIKIGDTPLAAAAIERESKALSRLAASSVSDNIPLWLLEDNWGHYTILVQSAFVTSHSRQIPRLTQSHFDFLTKLSHLRRNPLPLPETSYWQTIEKNLNTHSRDQLPPSLLHIVHHLKNKFSDSSSVLCHQTHGDFTPWNIKQKHKDFLVLDWEDSQEQGPAFTDIFHFLYRQASLIGSWPGAVKLLGKFRQANSQLARQAQYSQVDAQLNLSLWLIQEYFNRPCPHIVEMMEEHRKLSLS